MEVRFETIGVVFSQGKWITIRCTSITIADDGDEL